MTPIILQHTKLGAIRCLRDPYTSVVKILGVPYGTLPQRFARAQPLETLENSVRFSSHVFDATRPGPSSIQPWGSVTTDASNIPLPTDNLPDNEDQSEDCLNLSIRIPTICLHDDGSLRADSKLPVLVFLHGGAFFLGSANRPYYDPTNLILHGIERKSPFIFVGINYRLGALGFLHSPHAAGLIPENNGLYDQNLALQWIKDNVSGFGGDADNITIIGQSAGGESISAKTIRNPVFKRAIAFSGTPVTMPSLTPQEHHENFLKQAEALHIRVANEDGTQRSAKDIADDMIKVDVGKIRDLAWVGLPCSDSEIFTMEKPSMEGLRKGDLAPKKWREWARPVEAQIVGTATYDGGISYNMIAKDISRTHHAQSFRNIAVDVLGTDRANQLCDIYCIGNDTGGLDALQRICLFESDVGFFAAAVATAEADLIRKTYFHVFDLPNPFPGPVRERGAFATHTFDIVTLLGGVHEDRLPGEYAPVIRAWRDTIVDFVVSGKAPCEEYIGEEKGKRKALIVDERGVREVEDGAWLDHDDGRRRRLFELAQRVAGDAGYDVLWVDVCQRFLMQGE